MKYRKLGRDGPSVSAISMGRGSRPVRPGDALEQEFNASIVPIPGTNHAEHVEQNAAAAELELMEDELRQLDETFAIGAGAGARYDDNVLQVVGICLQGRRMGMRGGKRATRNEGRATSMR